MGRKEARESTMKLLFEINYKIDEVSDVLNTYLDENELKDNDIEYIKDTVNGTVNNLEAIDGFISSHSKGWKINRFAKVDLTVLRLAVYELKFTDTPGSVVINEAVELAKKYGTEKSGAFVNGILGNIVREG